MLSHIGLQVHYALNLPNLRRGRKRKSADPDDKPCTAPRLGDWTHEEDVQLLEVIWSGAHGMARCIPGRSNDVCKKRLQRIKKQLSTKIVELHDHASPEAIRVVTDVLHDSKYLAAVDEAREQLPKRDSDITELPGIPPQPEEVDSDVICAQCETEGERNATDALRVLDACTDTRRGGDGRRRANGAQRRVICAVQGSMGCVWPFPRSQEAGRVSAPCSARASADGRG